MDSFSCSSLFFFYILKQASGSPSIHQDAISHDDATSTVSCSSQDKYQISLSGMQENTMITLVNVYVDLVVSMRIAGTS